MEREAREVPGRGAGLVAYEEKGGTRRKGGEGKGGE